ncbi:hypothetical protein HAZT_HAZT011877, partial [Hyalella azteca]
WHVRTKDNIARVRRDEAQAAEEEKERERRAKLAEQEARTALLRSRARGASGGGDVSLPQINFVGPGKPNAAHDERRANDEKKPCNDSLDSFSLEISKPSADIYTESGNINFFKDLENGVESTNGLTNKEHEAEEKAEKEKYEKQIGLLTYLGQDSLEASKSKEWYHDAGRCISSLWTRRDVTEKCSVQSSADDGDADAEVGLKYKTSQDPLNDMIKYAGWKRTKSSVQPEGFVQFGVDSSAQMSNDLSATLSVRKHKKKLKKHKERRKKDRKITDNCKINSKKRKNESSKSSKSKKSCSLKKKHKKSKESHPHSSSSSSSDSEDDPEEREQQRKKLAKLREERLAREAVERQREKRLLAGLDPDAPERVVETPAVRQKYSSQFNPLLARQNKGLQSGVKYF